MSAQPQRKHYARRVLGPVDGTLILAGWVFVIAAGAASAAVWVCRALHRRNQ